MLLFTEIKGVVGKYSQLHTYMSIETNPRSLWNKPISLCKIVEEYDPCSLSGRKGAVFHRYQNGKCEERCVLFLSRRLRNAGWTCGACADYALPAVYVRKNTSDFEILNCTGDSVEVRGNLVANLTSSINYLFIYLNEDYLSCSPCNWLFRFIKAVDISSTGTMILSTRAAKVGEVLGKISERGIRSKNIEKLLVCIDDIENVIPTSYTTSSVLVLDHNNYKPTDAKSVISSRQPEKTGTCNSKWLKIDAEGRCEHTNCFVGPGGDPSKCFECQKKCDNGCGTESTFKFDGNFGTFDFGTACCNHDHCWSSKKSKSECDFRFLSEMLKSCIAGDNLSVIFLAKVEQLCYVLAGVFFSLVSAVSLVPDQYSPYNMAQDMQKKYERSGTCCGNVKLKDQICCSGSIYSLKWNHDCCGDSYINRKVKHCCNRKPELLGTCCNEGYNWCGNSPDQCRTKC
jgi:hypothetical protein